MVRPGHLDGPDRRSLLSLFGFKRLNILATDPTRDRASALAELHPLPLPIHVRGCV
jgi:hypothetical protein